MLPVAIVAGSSGPDGGADWVMVSPR
jgi:hypothetical protein